MESSLILVQPPVNKQLQEQLKKATQSIDRKLKKLMGAHNYLFKAPSNFKYNELDSNTVNIQTSADFVYLGKALAKMKRVEAEYNEVMKGMGIETYPVCRWLGVPVTAWMEDLTILIQRLHNADLIKRLSDRRAELNQFVSAEERLGNILEDLKELIK